ncbi:MAG: helix-turn-helix transcriptional regulator [Clostridia bacterium]
MPQTFPAQLIRMERLRKSWSQQGLCHGICAVSYLSKIEQGKAEPSDDIIAPLLERLGIRWYTGEAASAAAALADALCDAFFSLDTQACTRLLAQLDARREELINGPSMLDLQLLEALHNQQNGSQLDGFEPAFDERQRGLWLLLRKRFNELLAFQPSALAYTFAGSHDYQQGRYAQAIQRLNRGCELAAAEGRVRVMLLCRLLLGNCYSDMYEFDLMMKQYQTATHIAEALDDSEALQTIRYNVASTDMQFCRWQEAYAYFSLVVEPTLLDLHKLAICCEKLDKREEALAALARAATLMDASTQSANLEARMCALVSYRLSHPRYLREEAYGEQLFACFEDMRRELPKGYALFHLPWVIEWHKAHRQYKQAYELLRGFPVNASLTSMNEHFDH